MTNNNSFWNSEWFVSILSWFLQDSMIASYLENQVENDAEDLDMIEHEHGEEEAAENDPQLDWGRRQHAGPHPYFKTCFFLNMESKTCELICVGSIAQLLFWLGVADDYNHISHYFSNYFSILHSAQSVDRWTYDSLWLNALAGLGGMQTVGTFQLWIQNWFFCACSSSRLMLVARHQCLSQTSCAMDRLEKNWTSAASTKNNMFGTVDDWVPQS